MADHFLDASGPFDRPRSLIELVDNGNTSANNETVRSVGVTVSNADTVDHEGQKSVRVALGHKPVFGVHLSVQNASGTVGYMLIDLSDTTNWPHTNTDHIILEKIVIQTSQTSSPAFVGDIQFGFLSGVDATNGDFNQIGVLHGDRTTAVGSGQFDFSLFGMDLEADGWFGPVTADDTTWQTDTNLLGPNGATTFPAGNGDFVMKLVSSAGNIDIGVTVIYTTV